MTLTPEHRAIIVAAAGAVEAAARAAGVPLPASVLIAAETAIERAIVRAMRPPGAVSRDLEVVDMRGRQTGTLED